MIDLECIPFGVGHGNEGVCLLLKIGPYRILLDCGLQDLQSLIAHPTPKHQPLIHPNWPADLALCSHAHPDHVRGFWELRQAYSDLPIYSSDVTAQLLPLNWLGKDKTISCRTLPWRSPIEVEPGLSVELYPAGHLPGATAFLITYTPTAKQNHSNQRSYTVFYTGDFLLSNSRLVDGLPLSELRGLNPDVLILEGSFGITRHPHRRQQETQLAERMLSAIQQGQSVMLPVPALGLGQELLMLMRSHHTFTGKDLDIWVEEPIALGCDAYLKFLQQLPPTVQNFAQHQPLFWDERIRPRVRRLNSKGRSHLTGRPCIVLVSDTSNIQDYVSQSDLPWVVLLPERRPHAQADLGKQDLYAIAHDARVTLDTFLLAEHCDGPGTTQLIHNLRPQHVVFIHGSPEYLADLTSLDELANRYHLHSPGMGKCLGLPVGEGLIQPVAPAATSALYEGEVHELEHEVLVTLPQELLKDSRWQSFVDTGLIEASWHGEMLVLRGISQRELLMQKYQSVEPGFQGCANCRYYRGQRCWNQRSTLYGFKVTPDGYCPVFEAEMESGNQTA